MVLGERPDYDGDWISMDDVFQVDDDWIAIDKNSARLMPTRIE